MHRIHIIIIFLCSFFIQYHLLQAQVTNDGFVEFPIVETVQSPTIQLDPDSLFVFVDNQQKYIIHTIKPSETLYSIARFYALELSDLYYANPILSEQGTKLGLRLKIPISGKVLHQYKGQGKDTTYTNVYYKVKSGETMYRLTKVYFNMPDYALKRLNNLQTDALSSGQILHVGWINKFGIPDSLRRYNGLTGVLGEKNAMNRKYYEAQSIENTEMLEDGLACWLKDGNFMDKTNLAVMHHKLPVGSVVKLENPVTGRIVYANVVGPVPNTSYAQGSILMVSPSVAYALGVLDPRFYVKVHYWRK